MSCELGLRFAFFFTLFGELYDGSGEFIEDGIGFWIVAEAAEIEDASRALLNAGGASDTFGIFHRGSLSAAHCVAHCIIAIGRLINRLVQ